MEDTCDFVISGGGQAGIPLAKALAAAGKQIVLVERKDLGDRASISVVRRGRPPSLPDSLRRTLVCLPAM
jgi:choline dehydrogenase-like flavoprotein